MNDDEQPSTYGLPNHQTQCHCETCTLRHDEQTQHAEISEPRSASPPIYHHSAPCQCEQCISRYGSLPLLADAIDRSDAASSTSSYSKHSELSYSETSAAETRPGSSESGGPIRASVTKKVINCEFCGKLFSHTGDLNKHRRRHTGERPYPCSQCSRCFSHASNLLRHQKIHSGEMPHECPVCNKRFSRKDKMVNHIKNCHKSCSSPQS
ncbi:hypothetical protein C0J52_06072 [Blattella germanica]|nr:hypothetical protein C0J52_06072 [Blattella germanica]